MEHNIDLSNFFPKDFIITNTTFRDDTLIIDLASISEKETVTCPKCHSSVKVCNGRSERKNILDLPFLDHPVLLNLLLKEYTCTDGHTFTENPDDFLSSQSLTRRCQDYLSKMRYHLNGHLFNTTTLAAHAHIPVKEGVIRYVPTKINIQNSDRLWILHILDTQKIRSKKELLQYILENCEQNLHPNLVDLSLYDLKLLLSKDKRFKGRKKLR